MIRSLLLSGLLLASSITFAENWYVDITYTNANGSLRDTDYNDIEDSDNGFQLTGGYQVNEYFAVELGYIDLGQFSDRYEPVFRTLNSLGSPITTSPTSSIWYNPFSAPTTAPAIAINAFIPAPMTNTTIETKGLRLAAIGSLPLGNIFSLSFQGGALIPEYETTREYYSYYFDPNSPTITAVKVEDSETSNEPEIFLGLGVEAKITSSIGLKLFWEKYLDVGNEDSFVEQDIDTYNLAFRYRF